MKKNKIIICLILLIFSQNVLANLMKGNYENIEGNDESICSQRVIPIFKKNNLIKLKVYYTGWCNNQGPYLFNCIEKNYCTDGLNSINIENKKEYVWKNPAVFIWGRFKFVN